MSLPHRSDEYIPNSATEWFDWLKSEEKKSFASYRAKPATVIADFRRERAIARDYEGRELLELLQNASDQASALGQRGRVRVELMPESLLICNNGIPFSAAGVASLQLSHMSPKRRRGTRLIGNKGLGFRSSLNWTHTPVVVSGSLAIAYDQRYAASTLKYLCDSSDELSALVADEPSAASEIVLPILTFPVCANDGNLLPHLENESTKAVLLRAMELRSLDFTTVIGMPFRDHHAYDDAFAQINELRPEILLFVRNLSELTFVRNGCDDIIWTREGNDDITEVQSNGESIGMWTLHRRSGILPIDVMEADNSLQTTFEAVVAIPIDGAGSSAPFFSHFPTNIILPLPIVCHATLELEQNRKHLLEANKGNEFVLNELANLIAEVAEKHSAQINSDPWFGGKILFQQGVYPSELQKYAFEKKLLSAAKTRKIIPTIGGSKEISVNVKFLENASTQWLPSDLYPEIAIAHNEAETAFLKAMEVTRLSVFELKERIIRTSSMSVEARVAMIVELQQNPSLQAARTSALLLDTNGKPPGDARRVFLTPSTGFSPELPDWIELSFLNEDMRAQLTHRMGTSDNRQLQQRLTDFGILEYALATVVGAIVAAVNRRERLNENNATRYQREGLSVIFDLYTADETKGKKPEYPSASQIKLPHQGGGVARADTLYFGDEFGTQGTIVQALYFPWAPELLLADPLQLGLNCEIETLKQFLQWLGVAAWPREVVVPNIHRSTDTYISHALSKINYPAIFGADRIVTDASQILYSTYASEVRSIDGLLKILSNSDPNAIVSWLALDDRVLAWMRDSADIAKLYARPGNAISPRQFSGSLPSYVFWHLRSTAWLPSSDGTRLRPIDCVVGERAYDQLFPQPAIPNAELIERYGLQLIGFQQGWSHAGVPMSLMQLDRDSLYAKLLELPDRSPDGKLARPLYHWMLDVNDIVKGEDGPNAKQFRSNGKMWGRKGIETGYYPLHSLRHADADGLPETLLNRMTLVHLRRRLGADKVERVFGVKSLDRARIEEKLVEYELAADSAPINEDFQAAKPYIYKLRASQTAQLTHLQAFKNLQLILCTRLRSSISYEGETIEYEIAKWGWLMSDNNLYVCGDPALPLVQPKEMVADAIGEALASMFRITDGGDFSRMFTCNPIYRLQLLRRMCSDGDLSDFNELKANFETMELRTSIAPFHVTPAPERSSALPSDDPSDRATSPSDAIDETSDEYPLNTELQITPKVHEPKNPVAKLPLKIRTVNRGTRLAHRVQVTDGDLCERKAIEFEEYSDPPRWPISVGHMTGYDAPGCDILSFDTEEARSLFIEKRNLQTVSRFIEVKGKGSADATIELRGNEYQAASKYKNRYFLYRLHRTTNNNYELSILADPFSHQEALAPSVHVSLDRAEMTQRYELEGGRSVTDFSDSQT